jgi:hypothetical protein
MTTETTAYHGGWLTDTPCAGCGAIGEQIWLRAKDDLCHTCINEGKPMTQALVVAPVTTPTVVIEATLEPAQASAKGHLAVLEELRDMAAIFEIRDQEDAQTAADIANEIKRRAKALEEEEKSATQPLRSVTDKIRGWFAPARKVAAEAKTQWDTKILLAERRRAAEAAAAVAVVQSAVQAGNLALAAQAHAQITPPEPVKGLQVRSRWTAAVINQSRLPAEYLMPNMAAINAAMQAAVKENGEPEPIPGVKFTKVESLARTG